MPFSAWPEYLFNQLVDFGLCAHIPTERLETVGSPFWMAPEMIKHQPHTVLV